MSPRYGHTSAKTPYHIITSRGPGPRPPLHTGVLALRCRRSLLRGDHRQGPAPCGQGVQSHPVHHAERLQHERDPCDQGGLHHHIGSRSILYRPARRDGHAGSRSRPSHHHLGGEARRLRQPPPLRDRRDDVRMRSHHVPPARGHPRREELGPGAGGLRGHSRRQAAHQRRLRPERLPPGGGREARIHQEEPGIADPFR